MSKKFFYYYLAAHLVVFSLLLGLVADAFTVLSGGGVSVPDVVSDSRAVVGNGTINSIIANATTTAYLKQAKRVAGGCEKWDSDNYYRLKTWGQATTTYNGVLNTTDCYCPSGFTKILIRTVTSSVQNVHIASYEWRSHYYSTNNPPIYPICGRIAETGNHPLLSSGTGSCYKYGCRDSKCCCTCPEAIAEENYYGQQSMSFKNDLQKSSRFSYILRNYLFPTALAIDLAHGCGLIILHSNNNNLFNPITTTNSTWLCVNTSTSATVTGWDD